MAVSILSAILIFAIFFSLAYSKAVVDFTEDPGIDANATKKATLDSKHQITNDDIIAAVYEVAKLVADSGNETGEPKPEPEKCEKTEKSQYNGHCDLVEHTYLYVYHDEGKFWDVLFELKKTVFSTKPLDDVISYYVITYRRVQPKNQAEHLAYKLVPWDVKRETIKIENLEHGKYVVHICAMTATFAPTFLNNEKFSWANARPYNFDLRPVDNKANW